MIFPCICLTILGDHATGFLHTDSLSPLFFFSISSGSRDGSLRTLSMQLVLSLLVDPDAVWESRLLAAKIVGDVGVAELEELVDKPGTTIGP